MTNAPTNLDEYTRRFHSHEHVSGHGALDTKLHMPCPFCAAPDWQVYRVIDSTTAISQPATCKECGRSAKAIVRRPPNSIGLGIGFEMVQTGGPDQPEWLEPKMRRVEET